LAFCLLSLLALLLLLLLLRPAYCSRVYIYRTQQLAVVTFLLTVCLVMPLPPPLLLRLPACIAPLMQQLAHASVTTAAQHAAQAAIYTFCLKQELAVLGGSACSCRKLPQDQAAIAAAAAAASLTLLVQQLAVLGVLLAHSAHIHRS
jgi:hypothetical protein